jgi:hypothetical protein
VVITVKSQMIPGPRRGWKIELALTHPAPNTMRVTPYGQEMRDAVKDAGKALDRTLREVTDGRRTESLKLLKNSQDKTLVDGWDNFYKSLRREADSESAHLDMIMNQPILLKDNQNGKGWRLETTGGVEAKNREVEYRVVMETDDIRNGPPGWRMLECTLLGERKKVGPAILSTSSPSVPSPDAKPEPK